MQVLCTYTRHDCTPSNPLISLSNPTNGKPRLISTIHPLLTLSLESLLSIKPAQYLDSLASRLLYTQAICFQLSNSYPELCSLANEPYPLAISSNNSQLITALDKLVPALPSLIELITSYSGNLPQFVFSSETIANLPNWLTECQEVIKLSSDRAARQQLADQLAKEARKHQVLAKAASSYPLKLAKWCAEMASFPEVILANPDQLAGAKSGDTLASYWIRLLASISKDPINIWGFDSNAFSELADHIDDTLSSDSQNALAIRTVVRRAQEELDSLFSSKQVVSASSLNYLVSEPASKPVQPASDAPTSKPVPANYSSQSQYLLAKAKWLVASKYQAQNGAN